MNYRRIISGKREEYLKDGAEDVIPDGKEDWSGQTRSAGRRLAFNHLDALLAKRRGMRLWESHVNLDIWVAHHTMSLLVSCPLH